MGETLGWLTFSGVFERYPDLHVIMTEGYAGWLAFAIQFFDHHWSDSRFGAMSHQSTSGRSLEAPTLEAPPSYYLKRQAHATFMWDPMAIQNREITGTDCLLWGNDYPHLEGSFPLLGGVERQAVRRRPRRRHRRHRARQRGQALRHQRLTTRSPTT